MAGRAIGQLCHWVCCAQRTFLGLQVRIQLNSFRFVASFILCVVALVWLHRHLGCLVLKLRHYFEQKRHHNSNNSIGVDTQKSFSAPQCIRFTISLLSLCKYELLWIFTCDSSAASVVLAVCVCVCVYKTWKGISRMPKALSVCTIKVCVQHMHIHTFTIIDT